MLFCIYIVMKMVTEIALKKILDLNSPKQCLPIVRWCLLTACDDACDKCTAGGPEKCVDCSDLFYKDGTICKGNIHAQFYVLVVACFDQ